VPNGPSGPVGPVLPGAAVSVHAASKTLAPAVPAGGVFVVDVANDAVGTNTEFKIKPAVVAENDWLILNTDIASALPNGKKYDII
jgi:hypothetical protein